VPALKPQPAQHQPPACSSTTHHQPCCLLVSEKNAYSAAWAACMLQYMCLLIRMHAYAAAQLACCTVALLSKLIPSDMCFTASCKLADYYCATASIQTMLMRVQFPKQ
jgi:hypothetical protein